MQSNNRPMVSVIVLTYNQEKMVAQTIDSILSQRTNFAFEIVIGEDASPSDNTRAVCEEYAVKYPDIVRLMPKAANKGLVRNYIDCLRDCRGKYVAGCAGDDWWCDENKLQMQVDYLESNDDCVLVHTDMQQLDVATGKVTTPALRTKVPEGDVRMALFGKSFVKAPTVCYRRAAASDDLLNDLREQNFMLEDLPMWMILSQQGKFHFMPFHSVMYRVSGNSISNNPSTDKRLTFRESVYGVLRYYRDKFNIDISAKTIERNYSKEISRILIASHRRDKIGEAIKRFGLCRVVATGAKMFFAKLSRVL